MQCRPLTSCRRVGRVWLTLLSVLVAAPVTGGNLLVVAGGEKVYYEQAAESLGASLDYPVVIVPAPWDPGQVEPGRVVVAFGSRAVADVAARRAPPTYVASLVSHRDFDELFASDASLTRPRATLFVDQPIERQIALVRWLTADLSRLGVLVDEAHEFTLPATSGLDIVVRRVSRNSNVVLELELLLRDVDGLLAIPDPVVLNRSNIHGVLLSAYRRGKPVIGYSKPLVKAGALLSAYSSPDLLGAETAELVRRVIAGDETLAAEHHPRRFRVAVNRGIARVLGITTIPPDIEQQVFERVPAPAQ